MSKLYRAGADYVLSLAAERNESVVTNPGASFVIESGDELVVAGTDENISRFQAQFV